jgi:A118 family predicted phage portal protein
MNISFLREAYPDLPDDGGFYNEILRWQEIYRGHPEWELVRKAGLWASAHSTRRMSMLNTGKVLCDELAHKMFAEQCEITVNDEEYQAYLDRLLDDEGFWDNMVTFLANAFATGSSVMREYIDGGEIKLNFVPGLNFYPAEWDNKTVYGGVFCTTEKKGGYYYTLFERHYKSGRVEHKLYKSKSQGTLGEEVPVSELYRFDRSPETGVPLFQYFKPTFANNINEDMPLGISVYANAVDTLRGLDIAFDSFVREFVLGRKRIIVPSSCIRTVVDPETGKTERYFDTDDEVYQALKCDEERDLKITDNTVELRVEEHVKAINALLNILCFQVGLSAGSLSFDRSEGMKTATEVISQDAKTATLIKNQKNLLVETIEAVCMAVLKLAAATEQLPAKGLDARGASGSPAGIRVTVGFRDNIVIDDNTMIDNNIKLVAAGLKSKLSAVMEVLKCDEEAALAEIERINKENATVSDGAFGSDF